MPSRRQADSRETRIIRSGHSRGRETGVPGPILPMILKVPIFPTFLIPFSEAEDVQGAVSAGTRKHR